MPPTLTSVSTVSSIIGAINSKRSLDEELPAIVDNILNARAGVEAAQQKVEDMTQEIRQTLGDNVIEISGHLINRASDKKNSRHYLA